MFSLRDCFPFGKQPHMGSSQILDRVDTLIDDLLNDSDLSSSSLASILMAARESVSRWVPRRPGAEDLGREQRSQAQAMPR